MKFLNFFFFLGGGGWASISTCLFPDSQSESANLIRKTGLNVCLPVQERRRLQKEAEDLQREAEKSELSLDELTTLRQLEAKLGHALGRFILE
jgi:hypothetical protein